ncbi:hypothetical protein Q0F99_19015 [Rathayibacter oskolensis]|uniref:hypothetical protein n=1 Tax=Rathayibacter oskolensis TaxID=1891671 RepID=UPI00265F9875|nr:hypothetical protein [Rathayibacter oskolensis]WKK71431.1 hypothetical protein Q0F99_19015 [Rathayibacter oskolensis]
MDDNLTWEPTWLAHVLESINFLSIQVPIIFFIDFVLLAILICLAARRRWPQKILTFFAYLTARAMLLEGEDWQSLTERGMEAHKKNGDWDEHPPESPYRRRKGEATEE